MNTPAMTVNALVTTIPLKRRPNRRPRENGAKSANLRQPVAAVIRRPMTTMMKMSRRRDQRRMARKSAGKCTGSSSRIYGVQDAGKISIIIGLVPFFQVCVNLK